ncbi:hypothetical protein Lal_00028396 [Lupinus albus]|nr:hypothetical protein Lal_00028396 [Lupinus albus]
MKLPFEWNRKGQPLNTIGGNTLVSYITVVVRHNVRVTFSSWTDVRLNLVKERIWNEIISTFDVGEERKDHILKSVGKTLRQFKTDAIKCVRDADDNVNPKPPTKYENLIEEENWKAFVMTRTQDNSFLKISDGNHRRLEQNGTHSSAYAVALDVLWADAHKNKDNAIDNEQVQEVTNHVALGLLEYSSRIRGTIFEVSKRKCLPRQKRETKGDLSRMQNQLDILMQRFNEFERSMKNKESEGHQQGDIPSSINGSCTHATLSIPSPEMLCSITHIPPNHVKIAIDVVIDDCALLPIPLDEDIFTVGGAIGTYVAFPIDIVHVVPKGHEHSRPNGEKELDGSMASPPIVEHVSKKAKVVKSKLSKQSNPYQTNEKDCGYYMLYFMKEIIQ